MLATQLADQRELLQKAQDEAKTREAPLMAEFEIELSTWTDREAMLTSGYHELEDIVDGKSFSLLWSSDSVSG